MLGLVELKIAGSETCCTNPYSSLNSLTDELGEWCLQGWVESLAIWAEPVGYPWQHCKWQPSGTIILNKQWKQKYLLHTYHDKREGWAGRKALGEEPGSEKQVEWLDIWSWASNYKEPLHKTPATPHTKLVIDCWPAILSRV